ncbi:26288_t:CDS:2, partial [Gigaspora rosea]
NITNDIGPSNNTSAYVYLMDLSNYTWVTQFGEPTPTDFGKTTPAELVIIICSIVAELLIIGAIKKECCRYRNRSAQLIDKANVDIVQAYNSQKRLLD